MSTPTETLSFFGTTFSLIFAIGLVVIVSILSFTTWKRSGFKMGTAVLEALRVIIAIGIGITLNQPEWLETFEPEERPTLVVLWDDSRSMETRDVFDEEDSAQPARSRREWLEPLLEEERWKTAASQLDIVIEPLSAASGQEPTVTDIATALTETSEQHGNLRGVVLVSDGDWNEGGSPVNAATRLRMNDVPVFTVAVGNETRAPDLSIASLDAPTFGVVGKKLYIPYVIESTLPRPFETTIRLMTTFSGEIEQTVTIPAQGRLEDVIVWTPTEVGDGSLTLVVPDHPSESFTENNQRTVPINIRREALKVLLVESVPRWEYRYLRNALFRDPGVDVACLLFHPGLSKNGGGPGYLDAFPATLEELSRFDVVFLGDVGVKDGQLTSEQCRLLKGLVQNQAAGLVFLPGRLGHQAALVDTELGDLYPVILDGLQPRGWGGRLPMQFELSESGRRSLLTQLIDGEQRNAALWAKLPGFHWYAPVERAKAGSQVLAVHSTESNRFGRIPLLVSRTSQTGKILFMGTDSAWRWREGVEDRYHYRFWGQVVRWMAYQRHMAGSEAIRLFYSPDRPEAGNSVMLNANVIGPGGEPLQSGEVLVQALAPSGKTETIRLMARNEEWGLFSGSFIPKEPGEYALHVTSRESAEELETHLTIAGVDPERPGLPARPDVLTEIATVSRGKTFETFDLEELMAEIGALPEPEPEVRRLRLWCHPVWTTILIVLLGFFWIGRKMSGGI
ncbi:MAG: VWA domain-containing protein [Planctomycetota bacterium]